VTIAVFSTSQLEPGGKVASAYRGIDTMKAVSRALPPATLLTMVLKKHLNIIAGYWSLISGATK